jgi:acetyl-CoA carboxylase biotin carboxyl carrier protein
VNFKEILELIDKVADREIGAVEVEQAGVRVRIEGRPAVLPAAAAPESRPEPPRSPAELAVAAAAAREAAAAAEAAEEEADPSSHIITSPIVGTFYRAPNPESEPFVNIGDRISKGQVLCIVEAMKLMNEIESDVDGVLTRIHPSNGQPIEYGEKLFTVKQ